MKNRVTGVVYYTDGSKQEFTREVMIEESKANSPETPQNTELVAKIRALIESHASGAWPNDLWIYEWHFDDLAQALAETFPATNVPAGNDSLRGIRSKFTEVA